MEYDKFATDKDYQRSIAFSIFQIGVQLKRLSNPVKKAVEDHAPCEGIQKLHAEIFHPYLREGVWYVATLDIPMVAVHCAKVLDRERKKDDISR